MAETYSSKHIEKVLVAHGFWLVSQRGSHAKFRYYDENGGMMRTVILPMRKRSIPHGTFRSIVRQSGLDRVAFSK